MYYWDSSALVPLLVKEPASPIVTSWVQEDPDIATWALTRVEVAGAIERRAREGALNPRDRIELLDRLADLSARWDEVVELVPVASRAQQLLSRYPLRATDAMQLAAALLIAGRDMPKRPGFVCLDGTLATAAHYEGLRVLTWSPPLKGKR